MFCIKNNDPEKIVFVFSDGLRNTMGEELAKSFLKKGGVELDLNNLELMTRRSVFRSLLRRKMQKFCLIGYKLIKNLTKSEMRDYGVEFTGQWNAYDSEWDITRAFVTKKETTNEKGVGEGYKALPTYYPLRNPST